MIWKENIVDQSKRDQRHYRELLIDVLLNTPTSPLPSSSLSPPPSIPQPNRTHHWERFEKRGYCIWCKKHTEKWEPKRARPILGEIVNGAAPAQRQRQSKTYGGCTTCSAYFCVKGDCFDRYHSNSNNK